MKFVYLGNIKLVLSQAILTTPAAISLLIASPMNGSLRAP